MTSWFLKARTSSVYPHGGVGLMMSAGKCCGMFGILVFVPVSHQVQTGKEAVCGDAGEKPGKVLIVDVEGELFVGGVAMVGLKGLSEGL